MATKKDTVNIHGKEYETVASRVSRFRVDHPDWSIVPEVFTDDKNPEIVMIKTSIADETGRTLAVGHAEERRGSTQINKTSALENCETSSVGRALALLGYAGTELASADEVANAIHQQSDPDFHMAYMDGPAKELSGKASDKQIGLIEVKRNGMKAGNPAAYKEFGEWYKTTYENRPFRQLTKAEASLVIDTMNSYKEEDTF